MGGNAFAHHDPPLPTPRLAPAEYRCIRNVLVARLRQHFARVAVPIEGPAKASYGDVDIVVSKPKGDPDKSGRNKNGRPKDWPSFLETLLQSAARKDTSYAVPKAPLLSADSNCEATYVQVDVTVLQPDEFAWHYFMHCHGDIWNMLSPSLRRVGLVMTDTGLCLINSVIAPHDRKRSRLILTNAPNAALHYLGFEPEVFWGQYAHLRLAGADGVVPELFGEPDGPLAGRSFASETDLFAFIGSSRFFHRTAYRTNDLKAPDRRRMAIRSAYARFICDFVPSASTHGAAHTSERTLQEALLHFGKWEEYKEKQRLWDEEQAMLEEKRRAKAARRELAEQVQSYADAWVGHLASNP